MQFRPATIMQLQCVREEQKVRSIFDQGRTGVKDHIIFQLSINNIAWYKKNKIWQEKKMLLHLLEVSHLFHWPQHYYFHTSAPSPLVQKVEPA